MVSTEKISSDFTVCPVGAFSLDAGMVAEINRAHPDTVMKILNGWPHRLKAMILHAARWHWSSCVWLALEQQERDRLLRHIAQFDAIKAPVFTALVESFAEAIRHATPSNVPGELSRYGQSSLVDA